MGNSVNPNEVYKCLWAISVSHQVLCRNKVLRLAYSKSEIYAVHIWCKLRKEIKLHAASLTNISRFQFTHLFIPCWNIYMHVIFRNPWFITIYLGKHFERKKNIPM